MPCNMLGCCPEMRIRRADPRDGPNLIKIWESAVAGSHRFLDQSKLVSEREALSTVYLPACDVFLAQADRPLGFIALHGGSEIAGLFVEPASQGQGVGRALLNYVKDQDTLRLEVAAPNFEARGFYQSEGFEEVSRRHDPDLDEEMVIMRFDAKQAGQSHG